MMMTPDQNPYRFQPYLLKAYCYLLSADTCFRIEMAVSSSVLEYAGSPLFYVSAELALPPPSCLNP
jgi:hypothetical protein